MARYLNECSSILRNLSQELRTRCPVEDQYCCYLHCCFVNRHQKEVWETWYFWFGIAMVCLLMITSVISFVLATCKHRHLMRAAVEEVAVATIARRDGIIQPQVIAGSSNAPWPPMGTRGAVNLKESRGPLDPVVPVYPPLHPVAIVRGSARLGSARDSSSYTELALPPGYVVLEAEEAKCPVQAR